MGSQWIFPPKTVNEPVGAMVSISGNGGGGGVQFEILNPPQKAGEFEKWFSNPRRLP
jgi:hypothetical protein